MNGGRNSELAGVARCALLASVLIALGLEGCGPAAPASAAAGSDPAPAPVLTYYLDQTLTARGQETSEKTFYLMALKGCKSGTLPTTSLSAADVEKLGTERWRTWQRPNQRVVQRDSWRPTAAMPCLFNGIKKESIRELRMLPQTTYMMDLSKGSAEVQTHTGPPTMPMPPITAERLKAFEAKEAAEGDMEKVGNSHALGQPCVMWQFYYPKGSPWYTECAWTGGMQNGISPPSIVLWRKPTTTRVGDKWAIKTNEFIVGHLPAGSDAVFKVPAHAKSVGTTIVLGKQP